MLMSSLWWLRDTASTHAECVKGYGGSDSSDPDDVVQVGGVDGCELISIGRDWFGGGM